MKRAVLCVVAGGMLLGLVGCAGKGERIEIAIPGKYSGKMLSAPAPGTLRVAVLPFEDQRPNKAHLGKRFHLWGGVSLFDLQAGTVADASAQALVDYLNRRGWQATLVGASGQDGADVIVTGAVQALSIDATSRFMQTELSATNTVLVQVANRSDGSVVRERLMGTGSDSVFWFEPADAQALVTELFEKNFQKFLEDIRVEGRTIRLR
jgi:hypothetical protein